MPSQIMPHAYFKGKIVPTESATISIASHSLQYGSTCYAGLRGHVRSGKVRLFRVKDHHERLMQSMKIMRWDFSISLEEFENALRALIKKNRPEGDFYIRPFVFSDTQVLQLNYEKLCFELAIYLVPFGPLFDQNRGIKMKISPWKKIEESAMPVKAKAGGCYINSCLATTDAIASGYDEALMTNQAGHIVEASAANILMRLQDKVIIPPLDGVLDGITMRSVKEILEEEGIQIEIRSITQEELSLSDELILTGTAAQIAFVESVDDQDISSKPGPICQLLRSRMENIINNKDPLSKKWIMEIDLC